MIRHLPDPELDLRDGLGMTIAEARRALAPREDWPRTKAMCVENHELLGELKCDCKWNTCAVCLPDRGVLRSELHHIRSHARSADVLTALVPLCRHCHEHVFGNTGEVIYARWRFEPQSMCWMWLMILLVDRFEVVPCAVGETTLAEISKAKRLGRRV